MTLFVHLDLLMAVNMINHSFHPGQAVRWGIVLQRFHFYLEGYFQKLVLSFLFFLMAVGLWSGPGLCLSSILLNVYMKLLGKVIQQYELRCH